MISIPDIVRTLQTNRSTFDLIYLQAQAKGLAIGQERLPLDVVAAGVVEPAAYELALEDALTRDFFDILVDLIIDAGLDDGTLLLALREEDPTAASADLQAIVDSSSGLPHARLHVLRFNSAVRWTCQVLVDGEPSGTGVLIRANLVMTAWHVAKVLFRKDPKDPGGGYKPDQSAGDRLTFKFDHFLTVVGRTGRLTAQDPEIVRAKSGDWCFDFSSCHPEELRNRLPRDPAQLDGYWDFVIIKLEESPGLLRRWAQPDEAAVEPASGEPVWVFQHPGGQNLRYGKATIVDAGDPLREPIRQRRFLHGANAVGGSSGGPCFDRDFVLFGFHQGVWSRGRAKGAIVNRGVPVRKVLEQIKRRGALPPSEGPDNPTWTLGPTMREAPIFGTRDFQRIVWSSVADGLPRFILVRGDPGTGKTFCLDVLFAMLPPSNHLIAMLDAKSISKLAPMALVERICSAAGVAMPEITPATEMDATIATWLSSEVVVKLMAALEHARNDRLIWIAIKNLNVFGIVDPDSSELLQLLYQQTRSADWLRVVLDGMEGDVPESLRPFREWYETKPITVDDISHYLLRLNAELGLETEIQIMRNIGDILHDEYASERQTEPQSALSHLVRRAYTLLKGIV